jgi:hypothetical protein
MLLSCLLVPAFLAFLLYGMATVERCYLPVARALHDLSAEPGPETAEAAGHLTSASASSAPAPAPANSSAKSPSPQRGTTSPKNRKPLSPRSRPWVQGFPIS